MARDGGGFDLDKRAFLKMGLGGVAVMSLAGTGVMMLGPFQRDKPAQTYRFLRDADIELFSAVMPAMLAGLPLDGVTSVAVLHALDDMLIRAARPAQREVRKLFDLLNFTPSRWLTTGVRQTWKEAGDKEVEHFLQRWRGSSIPLFNSGYRALAKLCITPYFGLPAGYKTAGYPGPLDWMYKAINS